MAENTGTTVSNDTLNSLLRSGQNTSFDQSMFNAKKVEAIANPYANLSTSQINALQLPPVPAGKTLNPTQQASRDLTQATYNLNAQAFNNQQQAIQSNQEKQVNSLSQSAKDSQSQLLGQFGINNLASPTESSRNYSLLTDVGTRLRGAVSDITNQSLNLLNQNTLNFGQTNVQALAQAQQMGFAERQQQFSEDLSRGQETGQQYLEGVKTDTRTLAGESFDFNKQVTTAGLTGDFNGQRTLQGRMTDSSLISNRLNQALGYASFVGKGVDPTGIVSGEGFDPTKTDGQDNLQRQDFLNYQAPLLQQQIDINDRLISKGYIEEKALAEIGALKAQTAQANFEISRYANSGIPADYASAFASYDTDLKNYFDNPTPENQAKVANGFKKYQEYYGSDLNTYYKKADDGTPEGALAINKDAIATYGYNGNADLSSINGKNNQNLTEIKNQLSQQLVENLKSTESDSYINKIFFSSQDQKKIALATRAYTEENGKKTYGKYNFKELDTTGMNVKDVNDLNNAIAQGELTNDRAKTGIQTGNKNLDQLENVLKDFQKNKGLKVNGVTGTDSSTSLSFSDFLGKVDDYGLSNAKPLGLANKQALTMMALGTNAFGPAIFEKDATFGTLKRDINPLDNLVTNINTAINDYGVKVFGLDPTNINTDQLIRDIKNKSGQNELVSFQFKDKAGNPIKDFKFEVNPSTLPLGGTVANLSGWYDKAGGQNDNFANTVLSGVLGYIGGSKNLSKPSRNGQAYGASIEDLFKVK